jgi:hypothetical protein
MIPCIGIIKSIYAIQRVYFYLRVDGARQGKYGHFFLTIECADAVLHI